MPDEIYEVAAQAARYWFLFLIALIAWRSYRWLARDRRQRRKRLKLLPDAGFVGELVVVEDNSELPIGLAMPISQEGVLGCLRGDDVYVPAKGVHKKHLWYEFDEDNGLYVQVYGKNSIEVDGETLVGWRRHAYLTHGSRLTVGNAKLRLRMFAGFEYAGVKYVSPVETEPSEPQTEPLKQAEQSAQQTPAGTVAFTPEQLAAFQQMQWMAAWQAAQAVQAAQGIAPAPNPGTPLTPAQLAALAQQGVLPPQSAQAKPPYAQAQPTGAQAQTADARETEVTLTTAQGAFAAPPKIAVGGPILPLKDTLAADDVQEQGAFVPATNQPEAPAKHYRGNPLPPVEPAEQNIPSHNNALPAGRARRASLPPLSEAERSAADALTAGASWSADEPWTDADAARSDTVLYPPLDEGFDDVHVEREPYPDNPTFAPRVTFYPPVPDEPPLRFAPSAERESAPVAPDADWPYAAYPRGDMPYDTDDALYPSQPNGGAGDEPYEYADEDEAPRSLYVETDEAQRAKQLLWDKYLKGGGRK